ncbi:MAG: hypothetical protein E3J21_07230 [Anaerolineales bacterium]|nr:MAG: hypothetical protein E3J21_07230 [Anaerolineales bacterium]
MSSALIDYRIELNLWIALSILIYATSVNLAWRWHRPRSGRLASWIEEAKGWLLAGWFLQLLRFAYYVGLPFCLLLNGNAVERSLGRFLGFNIPLSFLMRGVLLPRAMGLGGLTTSEWFAGVGVGTALGLGAFFLIALGWWYWIRSVKELPWEQATSPGSGASVGESAVVASPLPTPAWWVILWEAIYAEMHWAFYRAGPIVLLDHYYAGVFLGFLILNLEWWTNPAWRHGWGSVEQRRDVVLRWSLAFVMAIIFLFTRNLWLAIALHWAIEMGCRHLLKALS